MVHVPMSASYGDEMHPEVSALMGSLCLAWSVVALGTKGHFPAAGACRGPCGVSGCLNWFFSPLWFLAAAVPTVPVQSFTPCCCQAIQE